MSETTYAYCITEADAGIYGNDASDNIMLQEFGVDDDGIQYTGADVFLPSGPMADEDAMYDYLTEAGWTVVRISSDGGQTAAEITK